MRPHQNIKNFLGNPSYRFLLLFLSLFLLLYYFNIFYMGITAPGNFYIPFLDEHLDYIQGFRHLLIGASAAVLRLLGHEVFQSDTTVHAYNVGGVTVVYSCLGLGVMSFFIAFVAAWPNRSVKSKLLFLPLGLLLIQTLNIIRFVAITLFWRQLPYKSLIDHHTLFNIILYAVLLGAIYIWISKRQDLNPASKLTNSSI